MTPSSIETAARRRLNAVSSSFWSSTEIIEDCLYFALNDMITRAKCYEGTSTTTSVAGTAQYNFPDGAIEIKQLSYDNQKLAVMSQAEYFAMNLSSQVSPQGRPTHYMIWGSTYTLYPTPDAALTISLLTVQGPGAITSTSTIPVPAQFHPRLVNGVAYYMLLKEVEDPRIPVLEARWLRDIQDTTDEWKRRKYADRLPRVQLEETSATTDTGIA